MGPELGEAQKLGFKSLSWSTSGFTQPKLICIINDLPVIIQCFQNG